MISSPIFVTLSTQAKKGQIKLAKKEALAIEKILDQVNPTC